MRLSLILGLLILMCGVAAAQGERVTGGSNTSPDPMVDRMGRDPAAYSRTVTGKIVEIKPGLIVVQREDKTELRFTIDDKARLKADKDSSLAASKGLTLNDYNRGDTVKVTYRLADNRALEVRLKRSKG